MCACALLVCVKTSGARCGAGDAGAPGVCGWGDQDALLGSQPFETISLGQTICETKPSMGTKQNQLPNKTIDKGHMWALGH